MAPPAVPTDARPYLTSLAHRAFRRPVTPQEVDRFLALVVLAEAHGDSYEEGLALAIQGVLVSPHFLFRMESDPKSKQARALTASELASRLSFFLWSSIPDDELLRAAGNGSLRKPAVLQAQVHRMLRDPKADRLAESFAGQWLEIRRLESVTPDVARFPEFDDLVRFSLRRETELFFSGIVREDRSILEFLDAKYTYMNGRLGVFYGMAAVQGPEFRKVDLTSTPRAGVLGQAGVLTVSSYANRTSPVLRGKWILDNLLNSPPPPPPPDVPLIDEAKVGTRDFDAPADGPASCEPRVLEMPRADGPAGLRPGEFQRRGAVAIARRPVRNRCLGDTTRWSRVSRACGVGRCPRRATRCLRALPHREAHDLRTGSRTHRGGQGHGATDRRTPRGPAVSFLYPDPRDRQQSPVSDARSR